MGRPSGLLVLGLGNLLLCDDGLGIEAVRALVERYDVPAGVRIVDGGTLGLGLLPEITEARDVILVDAVASGATPGSLVRLTGSDVPPAVYERLSPHQVGVADLLGAARLLDRYPERVVLLGLVPQSFDLAVGCSPSVAAGLPALVGAIAAECASLGHPLTEAA